MKRINLVKYGFKPTYKDSELQSPPRQHYTIEGTIIDIERVKFSDDNNLILSSYIGDAASSWYSIGKDFMYGPSFEKDADTVTEKDLEDYKEACKKHNQEFFERAIELFRYHIDKSTRSLPFTTSTDPVNTYDFWQKVLDTYGTEEEKKLFKDNTVMTPNGPECRIKK